MITARHRNEEDGSSARRGAVSEGAFSIRSCANPPDANSPLGAEQLHGEAMGGHPLRMEWLATVAHELRNPLAAIQCAARVLDAPGQSLAMRKQARETLDRQVIRIARLSDDLLNVGYLASGHLELRKERIDVRSVVKAAAEACRPQLDAGHHTLMLRLPSRALKIDADPIRLLQVLTNLIDNAAKYSDCNAAIVLSIVEEPSHVTIRVSDRGMGIAAELLPRVFDLFVRAGGTSARSRFGMGIGLSLVKRIVELHEGSVVASSPGVGLGSTFNVRLPRS
jgi:signal transduction histidine kinase